MMKSLPSIDINVASSVADDMSSISDAHAAYKDDEDWVDEGAITSSNKRRSPATPSIYGRNKETIQLLETYHESMRTHKSQIVLVHGESGSGKTMLVETLRDYVYSESHGYFVTGKYIQNSTVQEPYSAIMAAFSDLCDLTAQSDDFDKERRAQIQRGLGSGITLLNRAISNMSPFIHDSKYMEEEVEASLAKFKIACKSFLHTMATENHPVVIFLDDVQWADKGSRLLIEMFLQDADLKFVMFVLAYREKGAEKIVEIFKHTRDPIDIALTNLSRSAVHDMVCSILKLKSDGKYRDLSNLIAKRTSGNPLHIIVFMETVKKEGLLTFNHEEETWIFDIDTLQEEIMVSETLADLLSRKIKQLPQHMKVTLKVASLLGYRFDGSILIKVVGAVLQEHQYSNQNSQHVESSLLIRDTVLLALSTAVKGGYIEATTNAYHFAHDKVQSSFQSLMDESEEEHLHVLIGKAYLAQANDDPSAIYNAAAHLNCAPDALQGSQQQVELARINLEAAKYCEKKSAFTNAVTALQNGLDALGPHERWSDDNFDLTFEMMERLATAQMIVGDFDGCKESIREALRRGTTPEMKIKLLSLNVLIRGTQFGADFGFATGHQALAVLGVKLPHKLSLRHALMKLVKVKGALRKMSDDDLLNIPMTEDVLTTAAVKLLVHVCIYGMNTDRKAAALFSALLAIELSLEKGLSPHTPLAFAIYAATEVSLGNIERAYRYGSLALSMLHSMSNQEAACATLGFALNIVMCWKRSTKDLVDQLFDVGNVGFRRGDIIFSSSFCLSQAFAMECFLGTNLQTLEETMRETYSKMVDMGQDTLLLWYEPYLQHIIKMRSESISNVSVLSGEIIDEDAFFRRVEQAENPILRMVAMRVKAQEAMFFNQFDLAVSIFETIESYGSNAVRFSHGVPNAHFIAARSNMALYHSISGEGRVVGQQRRRRRRYYLKKGRKYTKLLQKMDGLGNPNVPPYLVFLGAEEASRQKGITESALRIVYNQALDFLAESDYSHLEGLLSEKAAFDFVQRGLRAEADHYFQRALFIYRDDWGATAKYNLLDELCIEALSTLGSSA